MDVKPFPWAALPRIARPDADLLRRAAALVPRASAGLAALGERFGIRLQATGVVERAVAPPERPGTTVTVIDPQGHRAFVWIDGTLVGALAACVRGETDAGEIAAPRAASAIESGLLSYLVACALDATGAPLLVEGVAAKAPKLDDVMISVDLAVSVLGARGFIRLYAPTALLRDSGPARAWSDLLVRKLPDAPVQVRVLVGRAFLPRGDLARIRRRAVVLLDLFPGGFFLAVGAGGFRARRDAGTAVITHVYRIYRRGAPMAGPSADEAENPAEADAEGGENDALARDLPVEVTCEIARLTVPAHQILGLAPGAVLPLGKRIGDAVELVCAGRVVARGELVNLDGEVGMRVLDET